MFDITQKSFTDFEKQLSGVDNLGRAIETVKESNSKIAEQLIQNLSTKCVQLETNLSIRVHDIKGVIEDAVNKGLENSEERYVNLSRNLKWYLRADTDKAEWIGFDFWEDGYAIRLFENGKWV